MECIWVPATRKGYGIAYQFQMKAVIYEKFAALPQMQLFAYPVLVLSLDWGALGIRRLSVVHGKAQMWPPSLGPFARKSACVVLVLIYRDSLWLPQVIVIVYVRIPLEA